MYSRWLKYRWLFVSFAAIWICLVGAAPAQQEGEPPAEGTGKDPQPQASPETGTARPQPAATKLPPGVLAEVNGRKVTVREYADYLLASIGSSRLGELIDRLLIEKEARKLGVEVLPDEVEKLVDARIERTIQGLYRGDEKRFLENLAKQGSSLDDRKGRLRQKLYYDRMLGRIIAKGRSVGEEDVKREFEKFYGVRGVRYHVRHILVSMRRRIGVKGERLPPLQEETARKRAGKILSEIRAGADFTQQVRKYSDDTLTRRNDGLIDRYHEKLYGPEFHRAVVGLSEKKPVSDVVRSPRGFHVIQWVRREVTKLEDVRKELEESLRYRPPTALERNETTRRLREAARIVR